MALLSSGKIWSVEAGNGLNLKLFTVEHLLSDTVLNGHSLLSGHLTKPEKIVIIFYQTYLKWSPCIKRTRAQSPRVTA